MRNKGFTLIELSIVIVIIGLIVAGIVAGQSLVTQAKLRNVVSDLNKFEIAFNTFVLQYDAWPGDIDNAFDYWGSSCGNNVQANCNGNNDKTIDLGGGASGREDTGAFEHFVLAGVIEGNYKWLSNAVTLKENIVPSPIVNAGYWYWHGHQGSSEISNVAISLGSHRTSSEFFNGEALTSNDALSIDSKIDDGKAGLGKLITYRDQDKFSQSVCVDTIFNAADYTVAEYLLTDTGVNCYIEYQLTK